MLPIARFRGNGIAVSCSETMIAEVVSNDVFIVTWEVPFGFLIAQADATLPDFFTPQVMTGQVTLDGESRIVFKPSIQMNDAAVKRIADIVRRVFDLPGIRCRVRLIGRAILAKRDNRPLDGFVPMVPRGRQLDLDFRNPGSGEPSDFESWFYLVDG